MGKARRFSSNEGNLSESRKQVENYGQIRQSYSGITSGFGGSPVGKSVSTKTSSLLSLHGGQLEGAIGFTAEVHAISAGSVDLAKNSANVVKEVRGLVFISSFGSAILNNVIGRKVDGQIIILCGIHGQPAITITHNAGGIGKILCPNDVNYILTNDETVILIDDVTSSPRGWRLIAVSSATSSADNLGNHIATQNLDLGTNDITNFTNIVASTTDRYGFDNINPPNTYLVGSATLGRINVFSNLVNVVSFLTTGLLVNGKIDMLGIIDMNNNDVTEVKEISFASTGTGTGTTTNISSLVGTMYFNVPTGDNYLFRVNGNTIIDMDANRLDVNDHYIQLQEMTAPTGSVNQSRLFSRDNGAGKTQLCVIFGTGAIQVISTEP